MYAFFVSKPRQFPGREYLQIPIISIICYRVHLAAAKQAWPMLYLLKSQNLEMEIGALQGFLLVIQEFPKLNRRSPVLKMREICLNDPRCSLLMRYIDLTKHNKVI